MTVRVSKARVEITTNVPCMIIKIAKLVIEYVIKINNIAREITEDVKK